MLQQVYALRAMEQAEFEERQLRDAINTDHLDYLKYQMEQQAADRANWNKTKHGDISGGFFDGFGKSCR